MDLVKEFPLIKERFRLRFEAAILKIFNQPDFDTPKNKGILPRLTASSRSRTREGGLGEIQHIIGSPRMMLGLHPLF